MIPVITTNLHDHIVNYMRKWLSTTALNWYLKHLWLCNADISTTPVLGCNYPHLVNMYFCLWVYNQSATTGLSHLYLVLEFNHFMSYFLDLYIEYFGVRIVVWNTFHEVLFKVQLSSNDWLQSIHFSLFSIVSFAQWVFYFYCFCFINIKTEEVF